MSMFITKIQIQNTNTPTEHSSSPNVIVQDKNGEEISKFGTKEFTVLSTRKSTLEEYKKNREKKK